MKLCVSVMLLVPPLPEVKTDCVNQLTNQFTSRILVALSLILYTERKIKHEN